MITSASNKKNSESPPRNRRLFGIVGAVEVVDGNAVPSVKIPIQSPRRCGNVTRYTLTRAGLRWSNQKCLATHGATQPTEKKESGNDG